MRKTVLLLCLLLVCGCGGRAAAPPSALPPTAAPSPAAAATATPRATAAAGGANAAAQVLPQAAAGFQKVTLQVAYDSSGSRQEVPVRFLLFFPRDYGKDPAKKWPLILFLHGSGEAGEDLDLVKTAGLPAQAAEQPDFPFVLVAPQLPAPGSSGYGQQQTGPNDYIQTWGWGSSIDALDSLLDQVEAAYAIDGRHVYLTGLSLGGFGAWEYALRYPSRFAAVVPIAGGYTFGGKAPQGICKLKDTPIWAFHGDMDSSVDDENSQVLVDALKACGSKIKFTLYPGVGHIGSWEKAYADPALYEWMLAQALPEKQE